MKPLAAVLVAAALLLTACRSPAPGPGPSVELREAQRTIERLQAENARLRAALDASGADADVLAELDRQRLRNADLQAENQQLEQLAGLTAKGELVETQRARFRSAYDPQRDVTTVTSSLADADGPRALSTTVYALGVAFEYPGQTLAPADRPVQTFQLIFETRGNPTGRFAHAERATLTLDGTPHTIDLADYTELGRNRPATVPGKRRAGRDSGTVDDRLTFTMDRPLTRALARASVATLTLPNFRLDLEREHFALAGAALLRSE